MACNSCLTVRFKCELVPQWRQVFTGFVALGLCEFIALEPALGGRGGVGQDVRMEMVFDLASDQVPGAGNGQRGGAGFFPCRVCPLRNQQR